MEQKRILAGDEPVVRRVAPPAEKNTDKEKVEKPKKPARAKLTGEDVAARLAERRTQRDAARVSKTKRPMDKLVRTLTASALGVGIIGLALGMNAAEGRHSVDVAANVSKIASLEGALASLVPADDADTAENLAGGLAAAQTRSDELAAAQQEFGVIAHAGNTDPGTNDGRPKQSVLKALEHRKALAGFFAPSSLALTDAQAYSFRTEALLGPGMIDPRLPWFTRYEPVVEKAGAQRASDPAGYAWKRASVTLSGTPGVMSVVWTNTDTKTGELLAWATARYWAETDTFQDLVVHKTSLGEGQQLKVDTTGTDAETGVNV